MTDTEALRVIIELYGKYKAHNIVEPRYEQAIAHIGIRLGEPSKKRELEFTYMAPNKVDFGEPRIL